MFEGIPAGMQAFMAELRERNDKEWYDAHKQDHRRFVREPFGELALELGETARKIDARILIDPRRCISRPRRDTRFTKDKSLYRNNVWISFKPAVDRWDLPLLFFEVMPDRFQYGLAFSDTSPAFMRKLRDYIADCPNDFRTAVRKAEEGGACVCAERYKRAKEGAPRGLEDWFSYKDFYWVKCRYDNEVLQGRGFLSDVQQVFQSLEHFYHILVEVADSRPGEYSY